MLSSSAVLFGLFAGFLNNQDQAPTNFKTVTKENFPVQVPTSYESTVGYITVPENRGQPSSRIIRLPVVIVHSPSESPQPDPVVYLAGGPGSSALNTARFPGAYTFLQDRDLIIIGQRGTSYAEPSLECPEYEKALSATTSDNTKQSLALAAKECRARLIAEGIRIESYTSRESVADLEDLRKALKLKQWNLYGVSYGTRLGLLYLRNHSQHVRSAVFDGLFPPQVRYDDESAINFKAALERVIRDCEESQPCNEAFPNLGNRFYAALERAITQPITVDVNEGETTERIELTTPKLAALIPLSATGYTQYAPLLMNAIAEGDTEIISQFVGSCYSSSGFAWGMRFSAWCSESLQLSKRYQNSTPEKVLGGFESAAIPPEVCRAWQVPTEKVEYMSAVSSKVPTLLFSGDYDPLTPASWSQLAQKTMPNARSIVMKGHGHSVTQYWDGDGCAMAQVTAFFADPEADLLPCTNQQPDPKFVVSLEYE